MMPAFLQNVNYGVEEGYQPESRDNATERFVPRSPLLSSLPLSKCFIA